MQLWTLLTHGVAKEQNHSEKFVRCLMKLKSLSLFNPLFVAIKDVQELYLVVTRTMVLTDYMVSMLKILLAINWQMVQLHLKKLDYTLKVI